MGDNYIGEVKVKLLTFLGLGQYYLTRYVWDGKTFDARFAPLASIHFLKPTQIFVFLTEEAEAQVFPAFQEALPPDLPIEPRRIPLGENSAELWDIFTIVADSVQEGDEIAFDITHGLRSFPYLALLAAAYLRAAMHVQVRAVVYGAFDVRDQSTTPNRAPLFDLSPMLNLLEWASATDRFNRTGDARYLASLLRDQQKQLAKRWQEEPERLHQLSALNNLAGSLQEISQTLRLIRPHQTMQAVDGLPQRIEAAKPVLQKAAAARPFTRLLDNLLQTYQPLSLPNATAPAQQRQALQTERHMLAWYAERELWVQTVALGREWLVSWVMAHLGIVPETSSAERHRVEGFINTEAEAFLQAKKESRPFVPIFLREVPEVETMLSLWKSLTNIRNDILHAGMRDNPKPPHTLLQNIRKALETIEKLPLP